ncbi:MAG: NUDIX domain-containing protein [Tepidisphaeraceae bacterium]
MKTIQYVIAYVVRPTASGHELLLGLRAEGRYMGGTWQLITGGIEPNETAWQAAVREVAEETGLPVRELYRLSPVTQFYRADLDAICVAPMFCAIVDANAKPTINPEHTSLQWVDVHTAAERLMWPTDLAALSQLKTEILENGRTKPFLRIS